MAVYTADSKVFSYMGRTDFSEKKAPLLIYAGSNIRFRFSGTKLTFTVDNICMGEYNSIGTVIDGIQRRSELKAENGIQTLTVEGLDDKTHDCMIFKRQAAAHYFRFISAEADSIEPFEHEYDMKLEFFGDSVSAGEVCEAVYYEGMSDPPDHHSMYDNSYFSYTFSCARKLNAYFHNNSQGGLALLDHTGYFYGPDIQTLTGLESTYDKLSYVPYAPGGTTGWDFSLYEPDIVIFAIGQNDAYPDPDAVFDRSYTEKWKARFKDILSELKKHYRNTKYIFLLTVLKHEPKWDYILDELCAELADPDVMRFRFRRCGKATDGHPRITEQEEMAIELTDFIRSQL